MNGSAPTSAAVPREVARRVIVLALTLVALAAGLWGFYCRQSLVTSVRPWQLTRVLLPASRLTVPPASRPAGAAEGVPVLVYHGILPGATSCNVTPEVFREHMSALKAAGYESLTMEQFQAFAEGRASVPERSVLVTFDDGRTDSFAGADPVLNALGYHATMFTVLDHMRSGKPFYLTERETRMMARTGRWDVQSHTAQSHVFVRVNPLGGRDAALPSRAWSVELDRLESDAEYVARVTGDLSRSRDELSALAGSRVVALAYPWGDYGGRSEDPLIRRRLRRIAQELYPLTFRQAGATIDETYNYSFDHGRPFRRVYITADVSAEGLLARLARGEPKPLPFDDSSSFASEGWTVSSGAFEPAGDGRALVSSPGSEKTRAEAFLDGSRIWRDYEVRARLAVEDTGTVSLIARRVGPSDYVGVVVSGRYACIEQFTAGRRTVLGEGDVDLATGPGAVHDVSFRVDGPTATLTIDGRVIARTQEVDGTLARGGVAVRLDRADRSRARLELERLLVEPLREDGHGSELAAPGAATRTAVGGR